MIIKYEIKENMSMFSKTPCPHKCNPIPVSFNKVEKDVMVGSVICQNHCKYFVEHNGAEKYIICGREL